jgi:hypothetical protein
MANLHLPHGHSDHDLALACALASILDSEELHVAWSEDGGRGRPVVPAAIGEPPPPFIATVAPPPSRLLGAIVSVLTLRRVR